MENKDKLKARINEFVDTVVEKAARDGDINYFDIEISNHEGNLNLKYIKKEKVKAY